MKEYQALTTTVDNPNIRLAIAGWLDAHSKSERTRHAYESTLQQFRDQLALVGKDVDADTTTIMLVAQRFASSTSNSKKSRASDATINTRLAILCSFYDYSIRRFLITPMDSDGHIFNPLDGKILKRAELQPYHNIKWLKEETVAARLQRIDRSTLAGKRDFILLHLLCITGRRLQEVASLRWRHVSLNGDDTITLTFEQCKGGKVMHDELEEGYSVALFEWLHAYYGPHLDELADETPLWVALSENQHGQPGEALSVRSIERITAKYLGVHTHVTRHSFTHAMIAAGATLPEIQDRLGHSSLHTTGIYAKVFTGAKNPHGKKLAKAFGMEK